MKITRESIRKWLRANRIFSIIYYSLRIDNLTIRLRLGNYEKSINNAIRKFRPNMLSAESGELEKLKADIRNSYFVCKSSPEEYFLMELYNFDDDKKRTFVTDKFLFMTMARISSRQKHDEEIEDKFGFYKLAKPYFKRGVVMVSSEEDFVEFKEMSLEVRDVVLKPLNACMGRGIEIKTVTDEESAKSVFEYMIKSGGKFIVEERIKQVPEMAIWNGSSVNTIRFLSFLNKNKEFNAIKPFLRTGRRGAVVDNAGSGGIFANINVENGILCSHGIDEIGNKYIEHPDSHIKFEGWQVPRYDELVAMVKEMHEKIMPTHPYIGWDMALTENGWVVIEANWGQFVNQYIDHIGLKSEFLKYVE